MPNDERNEGYKEESPCGDTLVHFVNEINEFVLFKPVRFVKVKYNYGTIEIIDTYESQHDYYCDRNFELYTKDRYLTEFTHIGKVLEQSHELVITTH